MMEQSLQQLIMQKQKLQQQLMELESAEKELGATDTAYRIIGNIMVKKDKAVMLKEIKETKGKIEIRLKTIDKQEDKTKTKVKEIQDKIMSKE